MKLTQPSQPFFIPELFIRIPSVFDKLQELPIADKHGAGLELPNIEAFMAELIVPAVAIAVL